MKSFQKNSRLTTLAIVFILFVLPVAALPDGGEPTGYASPADSLLAAFDRLEQADDSYNLLATIRDAWTPERGAYSSARTFTFGATVEL